MATITDMYATGDGIERIDIKGFQVIIWLSAGVPVPFLLYRLLLRMKIFRKLFIDDYLVIIAWFILLAFAITWQIYSPDMYVVVNALTVVLVESITDILYHTARFQTASVISCLLQAFGLWSIKSSFLAFFWRLGTNVQHQRMIWWSVAVWNAVCFAIWIGTAGWKCVAVPVQVAVATCNNSSVAAFSQASIKVETAVDILSDVAILVIPATLLWKSQLQIRKKLALGGIFSLTLFVMVASLVRVVITTNGSQTDDLTWMGAWAGIEMGVAIIVSCLCSFRTLFTSRVRSGRVSAYEAYRASKSFHCRGLPQSRQRQTLYRLGSFLTQNGKYADAKATVERGDRHDADTRQLHELDKSNFGKALVQKPCTVRDELAPVCHGPMPIRSIPAGVDADTDLTEKSWLDIESQEAEESPKSQNKTHDQG